MIFDVSLEKGFFKKCLRFMSQYQKIGLLFKKDLFENLQYLPPADDFLWHHSVGLCELFGIVQDVAAEMFKPVFRQAY